MTTNTMFLSSSFRNNETIDISANRFIKRLKGMIHACFKTIRIGQPLGNPKINQVFEERKNLKTKLKKENHDVKNKERLFNPFS